MPEEITIPTNPAAPLFAFARESWVRCPKCAGCAKVKISIRWTIPLVIEASSVHCTACHFSESGPLAWRGPVVGYGSARCGKCGGRRVRVFQEIANKGLSRDRDPHSTRRPSELQASDLASEIEGTCSYCKKQSLIPVHWYPAIHGGKPIDPAFGLPLVAQAETAKGCLFAYNQTHLQVLRDLVSATDRPAGGKWSMCSRLPAWVLLAKNRDFVTKHLGRLEAALASECNGGS